MPENSAGKYSTARIAKGILLQMKELDRLKEISGLKSLSQSLNDALKLDQVLVNRTALQNLVQAAEIAIFLDAPFKEILFDKDARKLLTKRMRQERSEDHARAIYFMKKRVKAKSQNQAIECTAKKFNVETTTIYRSLNRIVDSVPDK